MSSSRGPAPDVVCLAARELRSGRTLKLWRDELGDRPPYQTDRDALFVSFVANAECGCHLALGWPLPERVLDLSPAFRNLTNGLISHFRGQVARHFHAHADFTNLRSRPCHDLVPSTPEGKGLIGALRYYGLDAIGTKQKDAVRKRIVEGWPFTPDERERILAYCLSDVDAMRLLLPRILPSIDLGGRSTPR